MTKTVLVFGLISGAILALMLIVTLGLFQTIDFDKGEVIGYTSMLVAFLLIFFGMKSYRDNVAGGTASFGRLFKVGALITVVASLCYVLTWEIMYFNFVPDFAEKYQAHLIEKARTRGDSPEEIAENVAEVQKFAEWYKNPAINAAITFVEPLPVALIITLISAGVLRRGSRPRPADAV